MQQQARSPTLGKARSRREPLWQALNRRSLEESEEGSVASGDSPLQREDIPSVPKKRDSSGMNEGLIRAHRPTPAAETQGTPASRGGAGLLRATLTPDSNKVKESLSEHDSTDQCLFLSLLALSEFL